MENYNDKSLMEKVLITNEKSKKRNFEWNKYNEGDVTILTNWILKINIKNYTSREKSKKGTKFQRSKRHYIKGVVAKVKLQASMSEYWDYKWKKRHWSSTRNKSTLWLCYQVIFLIIFSIYLIIYIGIIFYLWSMTEQSVTPQILSSGSIATSNLLLASLLFHLIMNAQNSHDLICSILIHEQLTLKIVVFCSVPCLLLY